MKSAMETVKPYQGQALIRRGTLLIGTKRVIFMT